MQNMYTVDFRLSQNTNRNYTTKHKHLILTKNTNEEMDAKTKLFQT